MLMQDGQQQPVEPGWVFKPGDTTETAAIVQTPEAPQPLPEQMSPPQELPATQEFSDDEAHVEWTASEYIASPKGGSWFTILAIASVILAVVTFIVTEDIVSTVVIALVGIIVGVFAARQPETLQYRIDSQGIQIANKFYAYTDFKAFSVARDQAIGYISLDPLKRFMPPLVVHYGPEDEDKIAETLASYLPYQEHKVDMVENLSRRFKF